MDQTPRYERQLFVVATIEDMNEAIPDISITYMEIGRQQLSIHHSTQYSVSESIEYPLCTSSGAIQYKREATKMIDNRDS